MKFPVTIAEDTGLAERPESPVITIAEPPLFSQVPFDNLVIEEGTFHPFESPK